MPKWECPILDFPSANDGAGTVVYDFTSPSVQPGDFNTETYGMWHGYGAFPQDEKGVYLYVKDIGLKETDRIALAGPDPTASAVTGSVFNVRKVPKFVYENITSTKPSMTLGSLARLCGFDEEDIMGEAFDYKKAKRLGEIAENGEKTVSEAVLAMPFYLDAKGVPRVMTIQAPSTLLGPQIKQFRKKFTNYSLPPSLSKQMMSLVPPHYPDVPDVINPFGDDDLDRLLQTEGKATMRSPVVYLMEHKVGGTISYVLLITQQQSWNALYVVRTKLIFIGREQLGMKCTQNLQKPIISFGKILPETIPLVEKVLLTKSNG